MNRHPRPSAARSRGFTLVELLVVIGIIVLLMAILLPVLNNVRIAAYAAASGAQISRLNTAAQNYSNEFRAYPGPFSDDQVIAQSGVVKSGSENLTLGLLGGLNRAEQFAADQVGLGPLSFNPANPKRYKAFTDAGAGELSKAGVPFSDEDGRVANDGPVPEFIDHFPNGLPVLYLRARRGGVGIISDNNTPGRYRYDLRQISAYTNSTIGIGTVQRHGLRALGTPVPMNDPSLPAPVDGVGYDALPYFMSPQVSARNNATGTPRQADTFILISAGADRVYGTRDDQTNFGGF